MEKIKVYNYVHTQLKESFYNIIKEISDIRPRTTFTKEQEEEFLKDAIVIFDYLKSGIDIKPSEILINNGIVPFSCLEKMLVRFSEKLWKDVSETYTYHMYRSDKGKFVKIFEFHNNKKKDHAGTSKILSGRKIKSMKRKILFINSCESTKRDSVTKYQLKKIVDYALKNDIILLYDSTLNNDCKGNECVKSIYEIENARKVAIEFKRFSSVDYDKLNCGYIVIPESLGFPGEDCNSNKSFRIKDLLKEEIKKENISRKSLKNSFLNYACL